LISPERRACVTDWSPTRRSPRYKFQNQAKAPFLSQAIMKEYVKERPKVMSTTEGLFRKARSDTVDRIIKTQDPTLFKSKLFREPQSEKAHLTTDVRKQKYNQIEQDIKSTVKAQAKKR
jgi:hypothetical protein